MSIIWIIWIIWFFRCLVTAHDQLHQNQSLDQTLDLLIVVSLCCRRLSCSISLFLAFSFSSPSSSCSYEYHRKISPYFPSLRICVFIFNNFSCIIILQVIHRHTMHVFVLATNVSSVSNVLATSLSCS